MINVCGMKQRKGTCLGIWVKPDHLMGVKGLGLLPKQYFAVYLIMWCTITFDFIYPEVILKLDLLQHFNWAENKTSIDSSVPPCAWDVIRSLTCHQVL